MGRSPSSWSCSKYEEGLNRGGWTASEDKVLSEYIKTHGVDRWRTLPKKAGLKRNGRSCRLRWLNYLRPEIKRGNISPEEEELVIRLHRLLGNRWALIAGRLPGRTGNELKNYWNSQLSKRVPFKMGEFETKFQNSLKRKGVPFDSNYDEERIVGKANYSYQTAVRYSGRADVDNLESYSYDGINQAADDDVVEIDTSKSWCQLLMENCMGDYQYDRLEAINELQYKSIMSSSNGTDDLHQSTSSSISPSKTLQENHSSSSCNLFYQEFPDFDSSYFDSFLDPSMLSSSILP